MAFELAEERVLFESGEGVCGLNGVGNIAVDYGFLSDDLGVGRTLADADHEREMEENRGCGVLADGGEGWLLKDGIIGMGGELEVIGYKSSADEAVGSESEGEFGAEAGFD